MTVSHTEEHYQRFKKTMVSVKGSLPPISVFYVNIVKTLVYI